MAIGVSAGVTEAESSLIPTPSVPDKLLALDLSDVALNVVTPAQWHTIQEQPEKGESRGRSDVLKVFTRSGVEPAVPSSVAYPLWP